MTVEEVLIWQIVSLCAVIACSVAVVWYSTSNQPASRQASEPIEQPPASTPAIVEHDRPASAGAWRLEALLEVDRQLLQTSGEGRRRGIDKGTACATRSAHGTACYA